MYDTTIASKLLGQLDSFLGRISPHFRKPVARFIGDLMYGIMSQKDVKLSSIVRAREASTQSINFPPSASGVFVRIAAPRRTPPRRGWQATGNFTLNIRKS